MSDFWRFARLMWRYPKTLITAMILAVISASGLGIGMVAMVPVFKTLIGGENAKSLVDLATEFNAGDPIVGVPVWLLDRLPTDPYNGIILILVSLCTLSIFTASASFFHQYLSLTIATRTIAHIRQMVFRHVVHMPLGRVIERGPSEFVARVVRDSAEVQRGLQVLTSKTVAQGTRGIACMIAAIIVSWEVALVAPVAGILLGSVLRKFGKRIRRAVRGSLQAQENLLRIATESVQGLRTVKANTAERHAMWRFHKENKRVFREELRARLARALSAPIVETIAMWMVSGLAILFAGQILKGNMQPAEVVTALAALAAAGASFKPLASIFNEIQAAGAPATRLVDILAEPTERGAAPRHRRLTRHRRSIVFEHVTFRYPNTTQLALDDVSLRIDHGQRVAIVGPNGSGKTTLVSLLPRLLQPNEGRILIDDTDVESVSLRSLREQIGVVTQDTVLFRCSIAENLSLGVTGATREQIIQAARQAHAHEFIERIPGGYDANVAEQGASLSGGQRQRLAIARAILRNPSILVLDEATSQIDSESEAAISAALNEFSADRTAIVIAHRFASVRDADCIVVMDAGKIVDQGTHEALLARCDVYERLVKTQLVS